MTDSQTSHSDVPTGQITIPADLAVSNATAVHAAAVEALGTADQTLHLELDGDEPTVCALQLLISAKRSAESLSLKLTLSDTAEAAFKDIEMI